MKVKDLQGKTHTWSLREYVGKENTNPSKLHIKTRAFLREAYPAIQILEEVFLPGEILFLDFYLPVMKIAVEASGNQHFVDNRHFFPTKMDFYRAQARDKRKAEFCRINGIKLVYFYEGETEDEWLTRMKT